MVPNPVEKENLDESQWVCAELVFHLPLVALGSDAQVFWGTGRDRPFENLSRLSRLTLAWGSKGDHCFAALVSWVSGLW